MLRYVLLFLGISVISGLLGFYQLSAASADIAKLIFIVFLVLFLIGLVLMLFGR